MLYKQCPDCGAPLGINGEWDACEECCEDICLTKKKASWYNPHVVDKRKGRDIWRKPNQRI